MAGVQEQIEARMRALFDAYNRRDWDRFFADLDPDIEWEPAEENVSYRGRDAVAEYLRRWLEAWVEFRMEIERIEVSPDGDRTLATVRYLGRNKGSDALIDGRFFQVGYLRGGTFWRGREFIEQAPARAAFLAP